MAITQLCTTSARAVFPCFDHPSAKALFTVTLSFPSSLEVRQRSSPHTHRRTQRTHHRTRRTHRTRHMHVYGP
jgi:aminopeptidase N